MNQQTDISLALRIFRDALRRSEEKDPPAEIEEIEAKIREYIEKGEDADVAVECAVNDVWPNVGAHWEDERFVI